MIEDLDASIKALLEYELEDSYPDLTFTFEAPDDDFPSGVVTTPAVDLFLYDIREDLELRHNQQFFGASKSPTTVEISREPFLVQCTYLVTIWLDSVEGTATDEQMVSSDVIKALYRYLSIPNTLPNKSDPEDEAVQILQGSLEDAEYLPRAFTIQQGHMQNPSEFWSAMGGKPKPQFNYQVTFAMDLYEPIEVKIVNTVNTSLSQEDTAEAPLLSISNTLTAVQDTETAFMLSYALVDTDGSESLSVSISSGSSDIPDGTVLSDGDNSFTFYSLGDDSADISDWDTDNMTLQGPSGYTGNFQVQVTATAMEELQGDSASSSATMDVTITN